MQVCEGGWVWVHARRQTLGGLGRAAGGRNFAVVPDPIPQIRYPDPRRYFFVESFICLKSIIGRFQTDEWSLWGRSSWKWLFYWRKTRCALIFSIYIKKHAEIEFYLHKDFCAAGIEFYLHKDFRAAEIEFYLHKEFLRKINEYIWKFSALRAPICWRNDLKKNQWIYLKMFRAARADLLRIS